MQKNTKNLYKSRDKVIKLYNDYAKIIFVAMYKTKQWIGLKIFTSKQMLQRLHRFTQKLLHKIVTKILHKITKKIY